MLKIILADGQEMTRSGLKQLLEQEDDLDVVAVANGSVEAIRYTRGHKPDVLVLDPGRSGIDKNYIRQIKTISPQTNIVILMQNSSAEAAQLSLRAGATGFVDKAESSTTLIKAIRDASNDRAYLNPRIAANIARLTETLSTRETEILKLIALGYTNHEMANELFLSVRTIESHRAHINHKLGFSTRRELVSYALDHQMIGV